MPHSPSKVRSGNSRTGISTALRRHLGQRTVLGVALPVLSAHRDAMRKGEEFRGLSEKEIEIAFRELNSKFGKSDYHSTYLHRGLARFLETSGGRYKIRSGLLSGISAGEIDSLRKELIESLRSAYEKRQAVIRTLMDTCSLPVEEVEQRRALVDSYLSQLTGNRGEMFEVVSFAVLRDISAPSASLCSDSQLHTRTMAVWILWGARRFIRSRLTKAFKRSEEILQSLPAPSACW